MKLPSGVSRRGTGMVVLVVVTVALFLICAYLAVGSF
jgi:hypothetical protein